MLSVSNLLKLDAALETGLDFSISLPLWLPHSAVLRTLMVPSQNMSTSGHFVCRLELQIGRKTDPRQARRCVHVTAHIRMEILLEKAFVGDWTRGTGGRSGLYLFTKCMTGFVV